MNQNTRKNIRLQNFDYSTPGCYFLTLCLNHRNPYFGLVNHGIRELNNAGLLMERIIRNSPNYCAKGNIEILNFVVMHDHIHILVFLKDSDHHFTIQDYVTRLKTVSIKMIDHERIIGNFPDYPNPFWQKRFFDRYIRNETELRNISLYISQNPIKSYYQNKEKGIVVPDWLEHHEEIEKYWYLCG